MKFLENVSRVGTLSTKPLPKTSSLGKWNIKKKHTMPMKEFIKRD